MHIWTQLSRNYWEYNAWQYIGRRTLWLNYRLLAHWNIPIQYVNIGHGRIQIQLSPSGFPILVFLLVKNWNIYTKFIVSFQRSITIYQITERSIFQYLLGLWKINQLYWPSQRCFYWPNRAHGIRHKNPSLICYTTNTSKSNHSCSIIIWLLHFKLNNIFQKN